MFNLVISDEMADEIHGWGQGMVETARQGLPSAPDAGELLWVRLPATNSDQRRIVAERSLTMKGEKWIEHCVNCGLANTIEGHDGCLGTLPGVEHACCGHGNPEYSYIRFESGQVITGFTVDRSGVPRVHGHKPKKYNQEETNRLAQ